MVAAAAVKLVLAISPLSPSLSRSLYLLSGTIRGGQLLLLHQFRGGAPAGAGDGQQFQRDRPGWLAADR